MRDFSNKQLRGEKMGLGRNQQVMAKERERIHLEQRVEMPLSRNMKRQLGDGSKEIEKAVERAERLGLLASRSQQQVDNQVAKGKRKLDELVAGVLEDRLTLPTILEE
jgi:DNA-binding transcriptional MocR family regulator